MIYFSSSSSISPSPQTSEICLSSAHYVRRQRASSIKAAIPPSKPGKISVRMSSFHENIFTAVDDYINTRIDPPAHASLDPKQILSNNFAPVDELPPTDCQVVEGSLPCCLNGAYIRNGPNPQFLPRGPYNLLDGDGMVHSIKISGGKAKFCSRFVKTNKYVTEKNANSSLFPNFFAGFRRLTASAARTALVVARMVTGQITLANGFGTANTSLALFGGNLYALVESDLPYAIKVVPNGDVITLRRHDFDGKLTDWMTAHPKIDPETGEAFAFRYGYIPPFLTYFRIHPDGTKEEDVKIFSMPHPTFLHDFAITKKYAIFPDPQIWINPWNIVAGKPLVGADTRKVTRIGVIPRYAKDESGIKWFDVPGLNVIHTINAWDEEDDDDGDTIVLVATNLLSVEHFLDRVDLIHGSVEKVKIDLKTGRAWRQPLSTINFEFGVINPSYVAKKNRYAYGAMAHPVGPIPKYPGVVKLDLLMSEGGERRDCIVASRLYGPACFGGEPFFVPKEPAGDEDDGYVLCYVHDENRGESKFLVMDAKSPNLEIIAAVKLPQRVPYGFHGLFVRETDL